MARIEASPAPTPMARTAPGRAVGEDTLIIIPGGGSTSGGPLVTPRVGRWCERFRLWRDAFEQKIGPQARSYWAQYRNFDYGPAAGPGQDWRDRTVLPGPFKLIETRVPRLVQGLWGTPEDYSVRARGLRDKQYERTVRFLLDTMIQQIGNGRPQAEGFIKRQIDGERYKQITGHVWWEILWRTDWELVRTQLPQLGPDGKPKGKWDLVEFMEMVFDGVDVQWYPLDSIAVDLNSVASNRRWAIRRVVTTLDDLRRDDATYRRQTGQGLYENLDLLEMGTGGTVQKESFEEPRDTEHWPIAEFSLVTEPGTTPVELWLCWDNVERTLTKIANRNMELAHGLAPTPDGRDPFIGVPAVPVPNRVYGDSMLHWSGPLYAYQTRLARARADEILLNIWSQFIYREGSLRQAQMFWRPGGGMGVDMTDTPGGKVSDLVSLLPRRPVFQEAYAEDSYRERQAESTGAADAAVQGAEATSKSRDVSATEINQRVLQGSSRYQAEILYNRVAYKKPLLQKIFDSMRMNLTKERQVEIAGDIEGFVLVDLQTLRRPVDIVVDDGTMMLGEQARLDELAQLKDLGESQVYTHHIKHNKVVRAIVKSMRTLDAGTEEFVVDEQTAQQRQAAAMGPPVAGGAAPPANGTGPSTTLPLPAGAEAAGGPGAGGLAAPAGPGPELPPAQSRPASITI